MYTKVLLAVALATSAVSAAALEDRDLDSCSSAAEKIVPKLTSAPTPDAKLESFIAEQTVTITDPCVIPEVTGSMADDYSSYFSKLSSWYDDEKDDLSSLIKACSDVPEISSELATIPDATTCDKLEWASESGSSDSDNAAPRETGMALAAAAVAGIALIVLN